MIVDEPPADDFGGGEKHEAMDEEDDNRSQGSMVDGKFDPSFVLE